ncbi:BRO family protein [Gallibacterium salpingitidis]|uniref:BRO family protein n=1 Tax=Gallibacterium salpingitidis TaxID=505341 RepID=UPI000824071B|nr:Bro-N domain-containing protein [Gallibacterium salpingitidis]
MSNQVQFKSFDFKNLPVRIIIDNTDNFWFCANDVCSILDYANPRQAIQKNCKPKGVSIRDTLTKGGSQEMIYINEPNLYRLIIKSRKPEAEPFEAWVFEEVLPQIRKTGHYQLTNTPKQYCVHFTEEELKELAWLWRSALRMVEFSQDLVKPLNLLNSSLAGQAFGQATEYQSLLKRTQPIIQRITQEFEVSTFGDEEWNRVLPIIRNNI